MLPEGTIEKRPEAATQPEPTYGGPTYRPNVDIIEKGNELLLIADVPGVDPDKIDVDYERGQLSITGKVEPRQKPETTYFVREYGVGNFLRTFQIGESIDTQKISAEVKNGVLTLRLPKTQAATARKISVKAQ